MHQKFDLFEVHVAKALMPLEWFLLRIRKVHIVSMNGGENGIQSGSCKTCRVSMTSGASRQIIFRINGRSDFSSSGVIFTARQHHSLGIMADTLIIISREKAGHAQQADRTRGDTVSGNCDRTETAQCIRDIPGHQPMASNVEPFADTAKPGELVDRFKFTHEVILRKSNQAAGTRIPNDVKGIGGRN